MILDPSWGTLVLLGCKLVEVTGITALESKLLGLLSWYFLWRQNDSLLDLGHLGAGTLRSLFEIGRGHSSKFAMQNLPPYHLNSLLLLNPLCSQPIGFDSVQMCELCVVCEQAFVSDEGSVREEGCSHGVLVL